MTDRARQAVDFITLCCSRIGAFEGTSDPYIFLEETASQMRSSAPTVVFPDRYKEHVAYAVEMVASTRFLSPRAAIASVYLVTRFESYFRVLSGKLNRDGTWKSASEQQSATQRINDRRLQKNRVSSVALSYKLMKLNPTGVASRCAALDGLLYSKPKSAADGTIISDVGDRIEYGRHAVGHGSRGDISAEAVFYGLITAIVFYEQP